MKTRIVGWMLLLAVGGGLLIWKWRQRASDPSGKSEQTGVTERQETTTIGNKSLASNAAQTVRLQQILSLPRHAVIGTLTPNDTASLIGFFKAQTNVPAQAGALWALGCVPDTEADIAAEAIIENLFKSRAGQSLDLSEEVIMTSHLLVLGFLATDSDRAWSLLLEGSSPSFWREKLDWKSRDSGEFVYLSFSGRAILGIGFSGRDEAWNVLDSLRHASLLDEDDPSPTKASNIGELVDAAFRLDYTTRNGVGEMKARFYKDINLMVDDYSAWHRSDRAEPWIDWELDRKNIPQEMRPKLKRFWKDGTPFRSTSP